VGIIEVRELLKETIEVRELLKGTIEVRELWDY
jgi:hypothetical protein